MVAETSLQLIYDSSERVSHFNIVILNDLKGDTSLNVSFETTFITGKAYFIPGTQLYPISLQSHMIGKVNHVKTVVWPSFVR